MDTNKLVTVLRTIQEYETSKTESLLLNLVTQVSQPTPESLDLAETTRLSLVEIFQNSPVNSLAPTYHKIIDEIGGTNYCGNAAVASIQRILGGESLNVPTELKSFQTSYQEFASKIAAALSSLTAMAVNPYEAAGYEIGFVVPMEFDEMILLGEKMKMWDRFIVICGQVTGEKSPKVTISRVGNGSVELFIEESAAIIIIVSTALNRLLSLYHKFKQIQETQLKIEGLEIDNQIKHDTLGKLREAEQKLEKTAIEDAAKTVVNENYKKITDGPTKAELRTQLGVAMKVIVRDIQQGLEIEITPPAAPDAADEESAALRAEISNSNRELKAIYTGPLEKRLLPFEVKVTADELRQLEDARDDQAEITEA